MSESEVLMRRRRIWVAAVCAMFAGCTLAAGVAQAHWGPSAVCGTKSSPTNEHCYALSWRGANDLGSIIFADDESADVYDWNSGGFLTQEQWISFSAQSGWIEMGQTEGNYIDCCTDRPFFAEETPAHVYHERIAEGSPGTNVYAHYLIYDTEQNTIGACIGANGAKRNTTAVGVLCDSRPSKVAQRRRPKLDQSTMRVMR